MKTFQMQAMGKPATVQVAYSARFEWADGSKEFMSNPDKEWQMFGISEVDRDRIKEAIEEHKNAQGIYRECNCGSGKYWAECNEQSQYCG